MSEQERTQQEIIDNLTKQIEHLKFEALSPQEKELRRYAEQYKARLSYSPDSLPEILAEIKMILKRG